MVEYYSIGLLNLIFQVEKLMLQGLSIGVNWAGWQTG